LISTEPGVSLEKLQAEPVSTHVGRWIWI